MKSTIKGIAYNIVCILLWHSLATNASAHVYLDYPYGGETFEGNTIITIQWHIAIPHEQLNWDLYFSTDGGETWQPIQLDLPVSQLTYTWVVPSISTTEARISIIQDNTDMDYQHESTNFTIVPMPNTPFIDITAQDINIPCHTGNQEAAINEWLNTHGGATAVGFCGDLVWSDDYVGLSNDCGSTGTAFVTFTAVDECGSAATSAYLRVYDLADPAIEFPANDMVIECSGSSHLGEVISWLNNRGGAIASDACSNVTWTNNYSGLSNECGATGSTTVIFTATDACGNSSTTSATFSVEDHSAPLINVPAKDTIILCSVPNAEQLLQNWLQSSGGAVAVDVCGNVTWTNNFEGLSDDCGNTGAANVIFTATDDCGNASTTSASFKIRDDVAPVIIIHATDTIVNCENPDADALIHSWLNNNGGAAANEMCGLVTWSNDYQFSVDTCTITTSISVRFIAIDECNNSDTTIAILTLQVTPVSTTYEGSDFNFTVLPNPASDNLNLIFDKKLSYPVQIFLLDLNGNVRLSKAAYQSEVNLALVDCIPGVYFIRVEAAEGIQIRKVMVL